MLHAESLDKEFNSEETAGPTRVALVGCGQHAMSTLLPCIINSPRATLVAVCDLDSSKLRSLLLRFPSLTITTDAATLLKTVDDLDAIVVAAPPQIHTSVAAMAIETGRSVFVEKPPATDLKQMQALANAAVAKGVTTAVGHNLRHSQAWGAFKESLSETSFGDLVCVRVTYDASQPRGPRWDLGSLMRAFLLSHAIHAIDLIVDLLGEVNVVRVDGDILADSGCVLCLQFRSERGVIGSLAISNCAPRFEVSVQAASSRSQLLRLRSLRLVEWSGSLGSTRWSRVWEPRGLEAGHVIAGYQGEIDAFIDACRSASPGLPSFAEECATYRVMEQVMTQLGAVEKRMSPCVE